MNEKFNSFTTINNDSTISKTYVTAYVSDKILTANDTPDKKGKLVIVDNTDENNPIIDLISKYGLFIDDIFIAGGYGFRTYEDAKNIIDSVNGFNTVYENITNSINELNNKKFILEIGEQSTDDTDLSPKYLDMQKNKYGYITSYKYLDVEKVDTTNIISEVEGEQITETITKYIISIREKLDINYIKEIEITPINDYIEIKENLNTSDFNVKVTIYNNLISDSSDNSHNIAYNDNLEVYLKSSTSIDTIDNPLSPIQLSNDVEAYDVNKSFSKPIVSYEDDLILYIKDSNDNIVYSEVFKGLLKWKDKLSFMSDSTTTEPRNQNINYNTYNFRDTSVDSYIIYLDLFTTIIPTYFNQNNILIDYNTDMYLEFQNNDQSYDYIILRNEYNIEFYYNGIKSNNWINKKIGDYYIWQSPQQYKGHHIWKIIIK